MLSKLAKATGHPDVECANLFRDGAELYGALPSAGVGEAKPFVEPPVWDALSGDCVQSNAEVLKSLRTDDNEAALHALAVEDARLGRMSAPRPARDVDLSQARLVPRFAVVQGEKVRAVDNMSWSASDGGPRKRKRAEVKAASLNGHCTTPECIAHDHLDDLHAAMQRHFELSGQVRGRVSLVYVPPLLMGRAARRQVSGKWTSTRRSGVFLCARPTNGLLASPTYLRVCVWNALRALLTHCACKVNRGLHLIMPCRSALRAQCLHGIVWGRCLPTSPASFCTFPCFATWMTSSRRKGEFVHVLLRSKFGLVYLCGAGTRRRSTPCRSLPGWSVCYLGERPSQSASWNLEEN